MIFISQVSRSIGALAGLALGDAFGAPFEGGPPPEHNIHEPGNFGINPIIYWQFTDDTKQTLAISKSILKCGHFDSMAAINALIDEYERDPRFYGPTSGRVFSMIQNGCAPLEAAQILFEEEGRGRTNGSVMRGVPIGIFYPPEEVWAYSLAASRITHFHPVACEASAVFNTIISCLVRGMDIAVAVDRAINSCEIRDVRERIISPEKYPLNPSMDALDTLHTSLSIALSTDSFVDAVTEAVMLGGDTDTIAALSGALKGAEYGIGSLPEKWLMHTEGIDEVIACGRALWNIRKY
ncbi:ADP-ribosylglycohydrolase family protein [Methanogenium marinum]|uniref:ADP-ribosylglycohydrolase family protein n=1 Tax=Methanogenium marinum TaxID=348610 RepID=A0A9Q4KRE8_9EURY|nr:ADP-ribosylglycohydrolase family protein [Methanogenium marinum]MDE4907066.1 ADP-ribosylglycohydrolase family protein [Methanogenium marinum]